MSKEFIGDHAGAAATCMEASLTAKRIMEKGGNAVDAAVAAALTSCVARPGATGLGGYGGALAFYDASKRAAFAINFDSRAPKGYRDELYAETRSRFKGYRAMSVPANVAGLDLALRTFGTMKWSEVSGDAIRLADEGITVENDLINSLEKWLPAVDDVSKRAFLPDGVVPRLGEKFRQRDLAKLLQHLADDGPASFYEGDIARQIIKQIQSHGGVMSEDDLKQELAHQVEPLRITYRGHDIYTPPLPSGGLTILEILKTLDRFDLSQMEAWTAEPMHLFAEASKHAWNDRLASLGDPDFVKDPAQFLSDARVDEIEKVIRAGTIYQTSLAAPPGARHTANVCCVDSKHNLCSLTCTHGETMGCFVVIDGLGLVLNNGMSRFLYNGNGPNRVAPGKRVFHNMCPVVIARDQHPVATLGHTGGPTIISITAQMAMGLIDFRRSVSQVVSDPRLHTDGREPIQIAHEFPEETVKAMEKRGHKFEKLGYIGGPPDAIMINHSSQQIHAASGTKDDAAVVL
ncbi:MAG TPA: gamma-glutamyltransferase [Tepidisphaeraceae bacterium]|nr:gamma-glutamyltransferase [Tepidisphaeraceae bacterium]